MSTYLVLTIIGSLWFSIGLAIFLRLFNIPPSLSETYYNLEKTRKKNGAFFYLYLIVTVFLLLPPMVQVAQYWGFLCGVGLAFVGAAPAFKSDQKYIHFIGAIVSAISSIFILIVIKKWWVLFIITAIVAGLSIWTKTYKSSLTFWLEMIAFYSLFLGLLIFFI